MASLFPQCYNTSSGTHPWLQPERPAGRLRHHHGETPQGNSRAGGQGVALPGANMQSRDRGLPTLLLVLAGSLQPHCLPRGGRSSTPQPSLSALSCTKAGGPSSPEEAMGRRSFPLLCGAAALCAQPRAFIRGFLSASQAQINSAAAAALLRCSAPALLPACTELAARNRG